MYQNKEFLTDLRGLVVLKRTSFVKPVIKSKISIFFPNNFTNLKKHCFLWLNYCLGYTAWVICECAWETYVPRPPRPSVWFWRLNIYIDIIHCLYLHFVSFFHTEFSLTVETLPYERQVQGIFRLHHQGVLLLTWINFNLRISNYSYYKVWDEITHPFLNFNGGAVEVWKWINNFISHFTGQVNIYSCWDLIKSMLLKGHPEWLLSSHKAMPWTDALCSQNIRW